MLNLIKKFLSPLNEKKDDKNLKINILNSSKNFPEPKIQKLKNYRKLSKY